MSISIVAPAGGAPSPESYLVYAHFTLDTNEIFYVGKGTRKRWQNAAGWGGGAKANPGGISHVLDHPTRKAYGYTWTRA